MEDELGDTISHDFLVCGWQKKKIFLVPVWGRNLFHHHSIMLSHFTGYDHYE
jgi:hypothetical protein